MIGDILIVVCTLRVEISFDNFYFVLNFVHSKLTSLTFMRLSEREGL
jgi:hypothetical protein